MFLYTNYTKDFFTYCVMTTKRQFFVNEGDKPVSYTHLDVYKRQLQYRQMYWLLGRRSPVTLESKLIIYNVILKPTWTYGIKLWGTASTSNIEILQRFQNVVLRAMVNAP